MTAIYFVVAVGSLQWLWVECANAKQVTEFRKSQRDRRRP